MSKVRMKDIAQKLGVSIVTVHNALHDKKGVSEEIRKKVLELSNKMGYDKEKEHSQQFLWKIGVIIAENYLAQYVTYYWKMYEELKHIAENRQCVVQIEVLHKRDEKTTHMLPDIIREQRVDGVILLGELDKKYVRMLREKVTMPIVLLDFYCDMAGEDAVIVDNFYGMYRMTKLLIERGMRRLSFVGSIHETNSIMDRYCGFQKALTEMRLSLPEEWLIEDRDQWGQVDFELPNCMPEAFVCNCDLIAGMVIQKLERQGYKVPEDISVVGFDNFSFANLTSVGITTYEADMKHMVKAAMDKIVKQLHSPRKEKSVEIISGKICMKNSVRSR